MDDVVLFSVLIAISLPAVTYHKKNSTIDQIEENMPLFLRDLAEMNKAGQNLSQSLTRVADNDYGALSVHIQNMDAAISWGLSFEEALNNFARKINTPLISRSVSIIVQANRAGGKVSDILDTAGQDTKNIKAMEKDRKSNMFVYVVICYLSFVVFLFVVLLVSSTFVPMMAEAGDTGVEVTSNMQFLSSFDQAGFIRLLYHAALIQGFVSGLVAGQMGEGKITEGLKHSIILTIVAWGAFAFFI